MKKVEEYPTVNTIASTSKNAIDYTSGAFVGLTSVFYILTLDN